MTIAQGGVLQNIHHALEPKKCERGRGLRGGGSWMPALLRSSSRPGHGRHALVFAFTHLRGQRGHALVVALRRSKAAKKDSGSQECRTQLKAEHVETAMHPLPTSSENGGLASGLAAEVLGSSPPAAVAGLAAADPLDSLPRGRLPRRPASEENAIAGVRAALAGRDFLEPRRLLAQRAQTDGLWVQAV